MRRDHFPLLYDSASPRNIPSGVQAIVYINGEFAWDSYDTDRMSRVYRMSELPETYWMRVARGVDCEAGALTPAQVVACCIARHDTYHHRDFTAYANLSTMEGGLVEELQACGRPFRLHTASWTGDPNTRSVIRGVYSWAEQYAGNVHGGAYDLSRIWGHDDLLRP